MFTLGNVPQPITVSNFCGHQKWNHNSNIKIKQSTGSKKMYDQPHCKKDAGIYPYQTPYDYTAEVTNGVKGLDLIECLKNYGGRFIILYRRQWSKSSPRKRCKKAKWLSGEALLSWEEKQKAKEKRKDISIWMQCSKE